jgi:low temperature requirement protein LtrA
MSLNCGLAMGSEKEKERERHASWLELFYDLVFAVAISQLGQNLSHNVSMSGFIEYVVLFVPAWWAWIGATFYATRFDVDDLVHRVLILVQMGGAVALAVSIHGAFDKTSAGFAFSYAAIRAILVIEYLRAGRKVAAARPLTSKYSAGFSFSAIIWVMSVFVPAPIRFLIWILAILSDVMVTIIVGRLHLNISPHSSHLPERMGLFVLIVLGETVFGLVVGSSMLEWSVQSVLGMGSGLAIAFSLWWVYFDTVDGSPIRAFRERRRDWTYTSWIYLHFPLVVGIAAMGDGISHVIKSEQHVILSHSEQWLMCGSVSLCLLSMGFLQLVTFTANSSRREGLKLLAYRSVSASVILIIAILNMAMIPVLLLFTISVICVIQIVVDLRNHPYHRLFKL